MYVIVFSCPYMVVVLKEKFRSIKEAQLWLDENQDKRYNVFSESRNTDHNFIGAKFYYEDYSIVHIDSPAGKLVGKSS